MVDPQINPDERARNLASPGFRLASIPQRRIKSPPLPLFMMEGTTTPFATTNGTTFHPDFMFCMTCHDKDEEKKEPDKAYEIKVDEEEGNQLDADGFLPMTKGRLRDRAAYSSGLDAVPSPLAAVPGVSLAMTHTKEQQSAFTHDSSLLTENGLNALTTPRHTAIVPETGLCAPSAEPIWVRSQFSVQGICCASEVPAVRRIVKPLTGVANLQINILNKTVHVQHDAGRISALEIAQKLTEDGFPSKVKQGGNASVVAKQRAPHHGRTVLQVRGALSDGDVPRAQDLLRPLLGISQIAFSVSDAMIHIDHDLYTVTSEQCQQALSPYFECQIQSNQDQASGNAEIGAFDAVRRSSFVESTIHIERLPTEQIGQVKTFLREIFQETHVRAVYLNPLSRTIKVEHDPELASILEICGALTSRGVMNLYVTVDGEEAGLYLPESSPCSGFVKVEDEPSFLRVHANVWVSGIFWILSLISYSKGREWFEWLGLGSVVFGLPPICLKAFRTLRRRDFDANCMMVTAALGSVALGEFSEAASVSFLFSVSEFLEAQASRKARNALNAIVDLRPDHANVIHPVSKEIVIMPADQVPLGSLISVKTGDKIAADGIVVEGSTAIDESSLTGEATPAHKNVGDTVRGGTINIGSSPLVIRTTTSVDDSAVARLIRLVEDAHSNRSPTEMLIDAFARSYTPTVMFMAIVMCTVPWAFGLETGRYWTLNGLIIVVVACPCALTISTPVTYAAGLAATAQRGIIVKGGAKLEAMGSVDRVVFDKTGTLTKGKFSVRHLEVVGSAKSRKEMLQLMFLIQERSSHPLATSLVEAAKQEGINCPRHIKITNHSILKGEGVTAKADGNVVFVGNERLFARLGMLKQLSTTHCRQLADWSQTGGTIGFIGEESAGIIGMYCVMDSIRDEAYAAIRDLNGLGIETMICSGDSDSAAQAVAREIGIPLSEVHSQLLPEDKLHFVGSLKRPQPKNFSLCREKRYVLFCGDGINDAPALAIADIGASVGEGAAMAMEISDITLMDSNLMKLLYTIQMGKRVLRTVKENIFISLLSKVVIVVATFCGKTTLLSAIASDVGIMLLVTLNGMKLLPDTIPLGQGVTQRQQIQDLKSLYVDRHVEMNVLIETDSTDDSSLETARDGIV